MAPPAKNATRYIIWSQKDFHTRAFAILLERGRPGSPKAPGHLASAIERALHGLSFAVSIGLAERASLRPLIDEGVSCESCHSAAETWLRGHTRADWTYAIRVSAGMHDLRNIYGRANSLRCLSSKRGRRTY